MNSKFLKKNLQIFAVVFIVITFFSLYTYKLAQFPTNITGDESTYLGLVYRILYSQNLINPLQIFEDTKTAVVFYWMALWIKIFGLQYTVFAMRFAIAITATMLLVIFYCFSERFLNPFISFMFTLLLGTSVWYINFARSGWFNITAVMAGMGMVYFLEKGKQSGKTKYFLAAGIFAAFCFYGYLGGYIYPAAAVLYILFDLVFHFSKIKLKLYGIFFAVTAAGLMPVLWSILFLPNSYLLRPTVVFIYQKNMTVGQVVVALGQQIRDVIQGLVFLDGGAIGKGFENLRYYPSKISIVDPMIRVLFLAGIIYSIFTRRFPSKILLLVYIMTLLTVGALTVDAPNLARTLPALPFIYFTAGFALSKIYKMFICKYPGLTVNLSLCVLTILLALLNIRFYFMWATNPSTAQARQPAIEYSEFFKWQDYQVSLIKSGGWPINNYQWYEIRKNR